jgi:PAS domain S-box-containing protein
MHVKKGLSRRSIFLLVAVIVAANVLAATAYTLLRLRAEAIDRHFDTAGMYARTFEEHLTHSFNVIDLTLANVAGEAGGTAELAAALRHAPYLRSLALLDVKDVIAVSSNPLNVGTRIVRDDFLPLTPDPRAIIRAGPPWTGRDFHEGRAATPELPADPEAQTLIPVLRDIARDNDARATALASVNTDYFLNYYGRSLTVEAGTVELLRYDGILLLSTDVRRKPGIRETSSSLPGRIAADELGRFEQQLEDGRTVLTAYRASRTYPFAIVVQLDKESGLAGWRREAERAVMVVFTLLAAAMGLATLYFARMERAARQRDANVEQLRLRSAALEAAANSIIITDQKGSIEWANPAFCNLSGYSMEETLGHNPRDLMKSGKQTPESYRKLWATILAGKVWRGELINRRKDGSLYAEDQTITPVRDEDGTIRNFIAVKQDITERKQAEKKMEELSRHLVIVQESARRRFAGELHDRTSPNLSAIGVHLDIMTATLLEGELGTFPERLEDVRALIEDTTASIREICSDLRPPVLDYAGLVAALESYIKQFQRRTGIAVQFDCSHGTARLTPALESVFFRIVQEALTNCAKHSRAKSITVMLKLDGDPAVLKVSDDGIGFDPEALGKTTHTHGLGLLTMRDMTEFSSGQFILDSIPGKGTRINVEIPSVEGQA